MRKLLSALLLATLLTAPAVISSNAFSQVCEQRVQFKAGTSGTTLEGKIKGYPTVNYPIRANAGQTRSVSLNSDHGGNSFNQLTCSSDR
jgi:hypothetical protein